MQQMMGGGVQTMITAVDLNTNGTSPGGANTAEVVTAVNAFLATLDANQRSAVKFDFADNLSRQTWSNFPTTVVARKGVPLRDLNEEQRSAVLNILKVALSDAGYRQVLDTRKSDDWLAANSNGGKDGFGNLLYYIAIYGEPSDTAPFMVQFGGHHVARPLTYNGDKVSQTPQFVGTEPTAFDLDGVHYEPVKAEASAMFGLLAALSDEQRSAAKMTSGTVNDLMVGPGKDTGVFPSPEGLLVSELSEGQLALVTTAISTYVDDLDEGAASKLVAKYESEYSQTRVTWANNTGATDESTYVRIDGPSVWIEFINTRSMSTPNLHYHSVYRDKTNDYGSSKPN